MSSYQFFVQDLFQAYYDARRNKRNTHSQLAFELNYESNILQLADDLGNQTYQIGSSICFVISDPVKREVFASDFRDRVVHHLIYNYIYRHCDNSFIYDSYSCRVGKGTHFGIRRVDHFIRSCSHNYQKDAYILKCDIKSFFMSIDKNILKNQLQYLLKDFDFYACPFPYLRALIMQVIDHDPTHDYIFKGNRSQDYVGLPAGKSLFKVGSGKGLPIGNLTSQLFANVYLHCFDSTMKHTLGLNYYGRYVDDFVIIHQNKQFLLGLIPQMRAFLSSHLLLDLHPKKVYLQHVTKGVKFLGAIIKPWRIYPDRRILGNAHKKFRQIKKSSTQSIGKISSTSCIKVNQSLSVVNSYLGMIKHRKTYKQRKKLIHILSPFMQSVSPFTKMNISDVCSPSTFV